MLQIYRSIFRKMSKWHMNRVHLIVWHTCLWQLPVHMWLYSNIRTGLMCMWGLMKKYMNCKQWSQQNQCCMMMIHRLPLMQGYSSIWNDMTAPIHISLHIKFSIITYLQYRINNANKKCFYMRLLMHVHFREKKKRTGKLELQVAV